MSDKTKILNELLRRNIWRSLLIMKSATLQELPGVVTGLSNRKARSLMRDLETHGYVQRCTRRGRPEYSRAVDTPSLPPVCIHCGRGFDSKACSPKEAKRQRDRETQTEEQAELKQRKTTAAAVVAQAILEVTHDAA